MFMQVHPLEYGTIVYRVQIGEFLIWRKETGIWIWFCKNYGL